MRRNPDAIICERCNGAEAVVHLTLVSSGVATTRHYCAPCASATGASVIAVPAERRDATNEP